MNTAANVLAGLFFIFYNADGSLDVGKTFLVCTAIVLAPFVFFGLLRLVLVAIGHDWVAPPQDQPAEPPPEEPHRPIRPSGVQGTIPPTQQQDRTNGLAIVSLVFGILSLVSCGVLGIVAIITSRLSRRDAQSGVPVPGHGLAVAGEILGWISTGLIVAGGLALLVLMVMADAIPPWKAALGVVGLGLAGFLLWTGWDIRRLERARP
jgi:hypothetical protein